MAEIYNTTFAPSQAKNCSVFLCVLVPACTFPDLSSHDGAQLLDLASPQRQPGG